MLARYSIRCSSSTFRSTTTQRMTAPRRLDMVQKHLSTSPASGSEAPVLFEAVHSLRKLILNRPRGLNSLDDQMVGLIWPQVEKWENSDLANVILFKGNGKSFCAGGDVKTLVKNLDDQGTRSKSSEFFAEEYGADAYIAKMKTPIITIMHGNTMGGGVGLSVHAPFRIATESTRIAMPETKIGLFPDVGANFFLARLDGQLGAYLALTSSQISGAGAYLSGFATHYVPSDRLQALEKRLEELPDKASIEDINSALEEYVADAGELREALKKYDLVGPRRRAIDQIFARESAEEIISDLTALENGEFNLKKIIRSSEDEKEIESLKSWAKATRETIEIRSPTSVKLSLVALREAKKLDIDNVFKMDMRIATACCNPDLHPDFLTGVTHLLIDKKEGRPAWSPSTLGEVKESQVQKIFFSNPAPFDNPPVPPLKLSHPGETFKEYPQRRFALPTEKDIQDVVTGEAKGSGSTVLTEQETVQKLLKKWKGKIGVREKVQEVLRRRCTIKDGYVNWSY